MPRIVKPKPQTLPIFALFHLRPYVYAAICDYAYKHNRGICSVMQDFLEVGLLDYLKYDPEQLHQFNTMDAQSSAPGHHENDHCQGCFEHLRG
jgi:hypothetical protein